MDYESFCKRIITKDEPPQGWLAIKIEALRTWWWMNRPWWVRRIHSFYCSHIYTIFKPQNRWATRAISRQWMDKDSVFEAVLYAGVIDFVEREKCFEVTDWTGDPKTVELANQLQEVYEWAKSGREIFSQKVQNSVEIHQLSEDNSLKDFMAADINWDEYNRLSAQFEECDNRCLEWIIRYRKILWT